MLLSAGWYQAHLESVTPTLDEFVENVVRCIRTVRGGLDGTGAHVPGRVGLTGVLLPEGVDRVDLGWAAVRRARTSDDYFSVMSGIDGSLTAGGDGDSAVTIAYVGDVIVEFAVPYKVELAPADLIHEWPAHMSPWPGVTEMLENLRLGLVLACPDLRPQLLLAWQFILDPLSWGIGLSWSDPRRAPRLQPTQLTTEQVNEWMVWAQRVAERRIPNVAVSIRRILAAIAERHSDDDVLLDAVIVWENLFGARTDTLLRISASLALLLDQPVGRPQQQKLYKMIYNTRSSVVHGATTAPHNIQAAASHAVTISILLLRRLFDDRADLLLAATSEERSLLLILGQPQKATD